MKEIKLSNKVIITDPCYGIQDYPNPHTKLVLDNVKEGIYNVNVLYSDEGVWGKRVAALEVINKQNDLSGTNLRAFRSQFDTIFTHNGYLLVGIWLPAASQSLE